MIRMLLITWPHGCCDAGSSAAARPILRRGHGMDRFEQTRKVKGIVVAQLRGDVFNRQGGLRQQAAGPVHAQSDKKVNGRAAHPPLEKREIMGGGNAGQRGQLGHLQRLVEVIEHVGDAILYLLAVIQRRRR